MFLASAKMMKRGGASPLLMMNTGMRRCFASVSASDLQAIKREDVIGSSDSKWIASYAEALVQSGDQTGSHSDALNEYFRKNFRKLSSGQALDVVNSLAQREEPAACLDSCFWVWESLEEALRAEVDALSQEEFFNTVKVFSVNYKGS